MPAAPLPYRDRHLTSLTADCLPSLLSGLWRHEQRQRGTHQGTRNHTYDKFSGMLFHIPFDPPINLMIALFNLQASYHRTVKSSRFVLTKVPQTSEMEASR